MAQNRNTKQQPINFTNEKANRETNKKSSFNIGLLIFCAILVYVIVFLIVSSQKETIVPYEVRTGSLAINHNYRAFILRKEQTINASGSGYIHYFANIGERVGVGNLVYIIDQSGDLKEYLDSKSMENNTLTKEELLEIRNDMIFFNRDFDAKEFSDVYGFSDTLKNNVRKYSNARITKLVKSINNSNLSNSVTYTNAINTGIVSYYLDGYEDFDPQAINEEVFNEEKYVCNMLENNTLVTPDDIAYKIITDENWNLIIPINEEQIADFEDESYAKVRFSKNQNESWGQISFITGTDGKTYLNLTLNNSMISFVNDRFVDVELILHDDSGLKIPNSSIVNKDFYLIPAECFIEHENDPLSKGTLMLHTFKEDGTPTVDNRYIDIYSYDKENKEYYVDSSILQSGTQIIRPDTQEKFEVWKKGTLTGVYYINKGYADFRQIQLLYQNEEYSIVKPNSQYGLTVYDYIVLNAKSVNDNQFVYN